jgi:hypothetical protein
MIECTGFKSYEKGCLQGFASLYIHEWDLEVHGVTLNMKNGKRWINFPSREYKEGEETKYIPVVRFRDKGRMGKFSEAAKKAIEDFCAKQSKAEPYVNDPNEEIPF